MNEFETITQSRKERHKRKSKIFKKNDTKMDTLDSIGLSITIMLIVNGLIFGGLHIAKEQVATNKQESIYDKCRIKQLIVNEDYTKSYVCKSTTKNETYFIHENESIQIKQNPYLNRPVTIYKNGTIE